MGKLNRQVAGGKYSNHVEKQTRHGNGVTNEVSMVRTITAWNHIFKDMGRITQLNEYFARSFCDKIYIVSMGMNTKVQGRLPLLQRIIFHSLLAFDEVVVMKFLSGVTPVGYDP